MAEETTTTEPQAEQQQATNAQPTGADPGEKAETGKTFTQADLDRIVAERLDRAERKAAEKAERARQEAEAKALQEQGKYEQLYQKAQADLERLTQEKRALELATLRRDVAAKHQLPAALVDRLRGEDEAAIEADAKQLIAALPKPTAPNINAGNAPTPGQSQNYLGGLTKQEFAARFGVKAELLDNQ